MKKNLNFNYSAYVLSTSRFIKSRLKHAGKQNMIIAVSGGIDSATALYLLKKALPDSNIFAIHLYYFEESVQQFQITIDPLNMPKKNIILASIKNQVDSIAKELHTNSSDNIRRGNIMARVRMIYLFDYAKKLNALVCGTENRTEYYLGYFTRFGDSASDIEIIQNIYKTQVREIARFLHVPQEIIEKPPTAGLWEGQTDEKELGFSYVDADEVLYLYFDKKLSLQEIIQKGYLNAQTIIHIVKQNQFKHEVPYVMETATIK